jgi:hypothetical protein
MEKDSSAALDLDLNTASLDDFDRAIQTLDTLRLDTEAKGDFLGADRAYQRVLELRKQQANKKAEMLNSKHTMEREGLEARHMEEFKAFNEEWDDKMNKFREASEKQKEELVGKQGEDYEKYRAKLEEDIPTIPKHAAGYLNQKRMQESLVRQKSYQEAHFIQQRMMQLEAEEQSHWGDARSKQIQINLNTLRKQQAAEMRNLEKKVQTGFSELKKLKAKAMEALIRRYQNLKKELANYQKIERNRLEGKSSMGATVDLRSSRVLFSASGARPSTLEDPRPTE